MDVLEAVLQRLAISAAANEYAAAERAEEIGSNEFWVDVERRMNAALGVKP